MQQISHSYETQVNTTSVCGQLKDIVFTYAVKALSVGAPSERCNRIVNAIRAVTDTTTPRTKKCLAFKEFVASTEDKHFEFLAKSPKFN